MATSHRPRFDDAQAEIDAIATDITTRLARARSASLQSLQDFRSIGEALIGARDLLARGEYLRWAQSNFGFSKQWCSCLTKLATSWNDYERACSWAENQGQVLGRKECSVDGALALIRKWKKAIDPAPTKGADTRKRQKPSEMRAELDQLRRQLAEAEEELQRLKGQLREEGKRTRRTSRARPASPARPTPLNKETKDKARKIAGLWHGGLTEHERATAEGRLRYLAQKHGYDFEQFLDTCGIESPVDWTSANAA